MSSQMHVKLHELLQELQDVLEHTPIPHDDVIAKGHRTVWYTWFETFKPRSNLSCLFEARLFLLRSRTICTAWQARRMHAVCPNFQAHDRKQCMHVLYCEYLLHIIKFGQPEKLLFCCNCVCKELHIASLL
jgi:hypothetical protein